MDKMDLFFFEVLLWGAFVLGAPFIAILGVLNFILIGQLQYYIKENPSNTQVVTQNEPFSIYDYLNDDDQVLHKKVERLIFLRKITKILVVIEILTVVISLLIINLLSTG